MAIVEERLDEDKHFIIVGDFKCGADDPLDLFLTDLSFEYDRKKLGITYLLLDNSSKTVLAFYTIKTNAIQMVEENGEFNALPMIEIARIAVHHELQHQGIGRMLFYDYILPKVREVEKMVAVYGVMVFVDRHNQNGISFYQSIGFQAADPSIQNMIGETFNEECDLYILRLNNETN